MDTLEVGVVMAGILEVGMGLDIENRMLECNIEEVVYRGVPEDLFDDGDTVHNTLLRDVFVVGKGLDIGDSMPLEILDEIETLKPLLVGSDLIRDTGGAFVTEEFSMPVTDNLTLEFETLLELGELVIKLKDIEVLFARTRDVVLDMEGLAVRLGRIVVAEIIELSVVLTEAQFMRVLEIIKLELGRKVVVFELGKLLQLVEFGGIVVEIGLDRVILLVGPDDVVLVNSPVNVEDGKDIRVLDLVQVTIVDFDLVADTKLVEAEIGNVVALDVDCVLRDAELRNELDVDVPKH
ncbi:MAG: hypothetical protein M1834_001917 [Cirrosporium novae-zelandiae]|nr:MAG: hypothetical protein M1834_001917 [Cirrosporium novae-zelandiae]